MELIDRHTKKIMETCKEKARGVGLRFRDETLEYIVTNRDMLQLSPKGMIPSLYDYWVHDVEVFKEKGRYELYPSNPYEIVINTHPAISFYNDNNPDWMNVMIFYHVLAHIDFFQNNLFFRHTWDYDFAGQALSDKRLIARLRAKRGRWVDYIIEFARGIDNLVGFHEELSRLDRPSRSSTLNRLDFYFDVFLQSIKKVKVSEYVKEVERYNDCMRKDGDMGEESFFSDTRKRYPEFEAIFEKSLNKKVEEKIDLLRYLMEHSEFLKKEENRWMNSVIEVVRNTSLFFQPQIRTKIMNEGWASYWHERLFLQDERINGHEVEFARVHSGVTSLSRVGLNPYALGMRLFQIIEESADKGKYSIEFQRLFNENERDEYDADTGKGREFIFKARENLSDFMFINSFVDQDFVNRYKLFVVGKRLDQTGTAWEYYVKSRNAEDYRQMLLDSLYHPPHLEIEMGKSEDHTLYLVHHFEGKPLVKEFIFNTLMGIEYLWGGPVQLETTEMDLLSPSKSQGRVPNPWLHPNTEESEPEVKWRRVLYTMKSRELSKEGLE